MYLRKKYLPFIFSRVYVRIKSINNFVTLFFAVALYVSAWIEIAIFMCSSPPFLVALYVSAWIEITGESKTVDEMTGRTLCECVD